MKIHIVQKGDTLWKIAKKYGVNFDELKSMNTQLSNPDLIMPGMKIKVPSGNVPVKNDAKVNFSSKKEMPIADHPFAKEKPKMVAEIEDTKPMPMDNKPNMPYVAPVPNIQQPAYPEVDVNNYYMLNMAMMPQMPKPQLPPKPNNVMPEMMKPVQEEKAKEAPKTPPYAVSPAQQKEELEDMAKMPNMPNTPQMAPMQNMPIHTAPAMQSPQYMVPVSPVMPGYGFCYPTYPSQAAPGFYPAMMPNQPFQNAVSPAEYDEDENENEEMVAGAMDNMPNMPYQPYPSQVAPAYYPPPMGYPYPYGCVPVSPIMPGSGFGYNPVMGAYGENPQMVSPYMDDDDDDDYEYDNVSPMAGNMPYPNQVSPVYDNGKDDCGCGEQPYQQNHHGQMNPYQQGPFGYQQPGYPMGQFGQQPGYPMGQFGQQPGYPMGGQFGQQPGYPMGQQFGQQPGYPMGGQFGQQPGYPMGEQFGQQPGNPMGQFGQQPGYPMQQQYGAQGQPFNQQGGYGYNQGQMGPQGQMFGMPDYDDDNDDD
ncbi:SafA/ExsA family spore coat assembly protein [Metabacillus herbersteinensis]|uniref:SafA/ExsA family spore coat assembly protein n=1 Tax=Metabacillus herbersteinensis TaxID=283816 RepID=A0ABV6G9S1_9BACI